MANFDVYKKRIANYSGEDFVNRFNELCKGLYTELGVLTFAFILYDESTPELRKALRDPDYLDALDAASGDHMLVFTLQDKREVESTQYVEMLTAFSGMSNRPSKSYSKVVNTLFGDETRLVFPSVLFFQVIDDKIYDYRIVPLRRGSIEESVGAIQELFEAMSNVLKRVEPRFYGNQREIFDLIRDELLNRKLNMYVMRGPATLLDLASKIKKIAGFMP
jgi:hypothetical protein